MPKLPTLIQIKTVITPIGVGVIEPLPITVDLPYETPIDVEPAQSLTVNITYTYTVTVS